MVVSSIASTLEMFNLQKTKLKLFPLLDIIIFKETQQSITSQFGENTIKKQFPELAEFIFPIEETKEEAQEEEWQKNDPKKCQPVASKSIMTTERLVSILEKNRNANMGRNVLLQPFRKGLTFYKPHLQLKIQDIIQELYSNPYRGIARCNPIKGWDKWTFCRISSARLLSLPGQSAITNFNS